MPKKYTQKALLTKPVAGPSHLKSDPPKSPQNESRKPSVNELIREYRRLRFKDTPRVSSSAITASVPPSLRAVLDLPTPQTNYGRIPGPARSRRIPGPPPPRSWLTDSIHASRQQGHTSEHVGDTTNPEDLGRRVQIRHSSLPEGNFPDARSFQHQIMKQMALNWDWHATYDADYLVDLPTSFKECLLSYLAIYGESKSNPLELLFPIDEHSNGFDEVRRLDLGNSCGVWTTSKRLIRYLSSGWAVRKESHPNSSLPQPADVPRGDSVVDSWDQEFETEQILTIPASLLPTTATFPNLRHLSLAASPAAPSSASWQDLLALSTALPTLTSLSLAYWPIPTYTPNAASTRVLIQNPSASSMPGIVYGGTDVYTASDRNWREAAGILRSLSKSLYCLEYLDLTGCGEWYHALTWTPRGHLSDHNMYGPQWNGGWRSITRLNLSVGWSPIVPLFAEEAMSDSGDWNVEDERVKHLYAKDAYQHKNLRDFSEITAITLRDIRKDAGGKWIEVELSDELQRPSWSDKAFRSFFPLSD